MKGIGYLLLVAGFLTGAYATALDVENVNWTLIRRGSCRRQCSDWS